VSLTKIGFGGCYERSKSLHILQWAENFSTSWLNARFSVRILLCITSIPTPPRPPTKLASSAHLEFQIIVIFDVAWISYHCSRRSFSQSYQSVQPRLISKEWIVSCREQKHSSNTLIRNKRRNVHAIWRWGALCVCCGCRCTGACSLINPACNAPPCCHLRRLCPPPHIFRHYLISGSNLKKKFVEHTMCILIFSAIFVRSISHFKKNSARCSLKCRNVFMWSTRHSCRVLMKLECSRQIFEKSSNIKFNKNLSSVRGIVPCGQIGRQTDRHDEANSRFSHFCERA
jgi:hypothetical protein